MKKILFIFFIPAIALIGMHQKTEIICVVNIQNETCAICLQPILSRDDAKKSFVQCSHAGQFHLACLLQWRRVQNNCPLCRHAFEMTCYEKIIRKCDIVGDQLNQICETFDQLPLHRKIFLSSLLLCLWVNGSITILRNNNLDESPFLLALGYSTLFFMLAAGFFTQIMHIRRANHNPHAV